MKLNPKLSQYFDKLKNDFQQLSTNPNKEHLENVKKDLKQITSEIDNINM